MIAPPATVWLLRNADPLDPELTTSIFRPAVCKDSPIVGAVSRRSRLRRFQQVVALGGIERFRRIDTRKENIVSQEPMRFRIGTRGNGRGIDSRDRRIDRVVTVEDDATLAERRQVRHHGGGDVIRLRPSTTMSRWRRAESG